MRPIILFLFVLAALIGCRTKQELQTTSVKTDSVVIKQASKTLDSTRSVSSRVDKTTTERTITPRTNISIQDTVAPGKKASVKIGDDGRLDYEMDRNGKLNINVVLPGSENSRTERESYRADSLLSLRLLSRLDSLDALHTRQDETVKTITKKDYSLPVSLLVNLLVMAFLIYYFCKR